MSNFAPEKRLKEEKMDNKRPLLAHLSMFFACAFWGLMAPLGKTP